MPCTCRIVVAFDLDDTLYKEIDFLRSGYRTIAREITRLTPAAEPVYDIMLRWREEGKNVFDEVCRRYPGTLTKAELLDIYRNHKPGIEPSEGAVALLRALKSRGAVTGIITDGREITQMNKIEALGLSPYFPKDDIVISESFGSEKPDEANYKYFMTRHPDMKYVYVADNTAKDFIAPNRLGWTTFCLLDDGRNIHKQRFDAGHDRSAQNNIRSLNEIISLI